MHFSFIFVAYSSFVLKTCATSEDPDEYQYGDEDADLEKIVKNDDDGSRLVGARAAKHEEDAPFLVALNIHGQTFSSCTGSLITPTFLITAAHCTDYIPKSGRLEKNKQCVEKTAAGGKFHIGSFTLQCRIVTTFERKHKQRIRIQNLEIVSLNPIGKAWMGVNDMNNWTDVDNGRLSNIKRTIMPEHAYQGGNDYGHYGGYDIAIMELERPLYNDRRACLPSPSFNDYADSKLAGYGKYFRQSGGRDVCQTNQYGPMKYHYCKSKCSTKNPPPTSRTCRSFFKDHKVPEGKEEVMIMKGRRPPKFCFRNENKEKKSHGWCYTRGDYYHTDKNRNPGEDMDWGFCSKDCFLDKQIAMAGVLRIVDDAKILPKELCKQFLEKSFPFGGVSHRPKILCVGKIHHWSTDVWGMKGNKFNKITGNTEHYVKRYHYGEHLGFSGYVASAGTCSGDSGGPVYQVQKNRRTGRAKYIVTGAVSGGRGKLGACGGINNPVHYTKIQAFVSWITQVVGFPQNKNLCWDDSFEERLRKRGIIK